MSRKYLIDANLPRYFSLWEQIGAEYVPDPLWSDAQIWAYAKANGFTIITKDADFVIRSYLQKQPPPWVIRLAIGNMTSRLFFGLMHLLWPDIAALCVEPSHLLIIADREGARVAHIAADPPSG